MAARAKMHARTAGSESSASARDAAITAVRERSKPTATPEPHEITDPWSQTNSLDGGGNAIVRDHQRAGSD
ncbi:MAG: hypothetical protein ACJ73L_03620 [Actinomycetes bacterium]